MSRVHISQMFKRLEYTRHMAIRLGKETIFDRLVDHGTLIDDQTAILHSMGAQSIPLTIAIIVGGMGSSGSKHGALHSFATMASPVPSMKALALIYRKLLDIIDDNAIDMEHIVLSVNIYNLCKEAYFYFFLCHQLIKNKLETFCR